MQSNHAKVEAIRLSALPKDTTSELAGLPSHYLFFYSDRQAGKLSIKGVGRKISGGRRDNGKNKTEK